MVEVKRKKGETFESFLRRFNKRLIQSGKLFQARKIRFHQKAKNRNKQREDTVVRLRMRKQKEYLKKIGRLKED